MCERKSTAAAYTVGRGERVRLPREVKHRMDRAGSRGSGASYKGARKHANFYRYIIAHDRCGCTPYILVGTRNNITLYGAYLYSLALG